MKLWKFPGIAAGSQKDLRDFKAVCAFHEVSEGFWGASEEFVEISGGF